MASATVDIVEEVAEREAADRPTLAACRTEPMPSTMVQKMIGEIIILIRSTNAVPSGLSALPVSGATSPTTMPRTTATITAM